MSHINQSTARIAQFTIAQLLEMPSSLNGEQHPVKESRVESITDSFIDQPLLTLLEITEYEGINILTSGRHRRASLAVEYSDSLDSLVDCLVYTAKSADEVVLRTTCANGSRSMNAMEKKELTTAAKYGFDVLSIESLVAKVEMHMMATDESHNITDAVDCFVLALALALDEAYDCGKGTGLAVARSLVTTLKKFKQVNVIAPSYDTDGTMLAAGSTSKVDMLLTQLRMGQDRVSELIDALVLAVEYAKYAAVILPAKLYLDANATGLDMVDPDAESTIDSKGIATYTTNIKCPDAWQRNASKWVRVMTPTYKAYISEALDVTIA